MIKVAVIGCGYWGRNLVRNFYQLSALSMVCDSTDEGRRLADKIAPGVELVSNVSDVMVDDVDAVVIATPADTHYKLAKQALHAGKDVLVEKPLALDYQHGSHLVRLAEDNNRILMVGHVLEYHPAIVRLIRLVRDGTLGRLHYIYSNRLSLGKIRREENILWSFAPHDIAVILRVVGSMPSRVAACGGSYIQPHIADVTVTNLFFPEDVGAHIHVSWLHPFKEQRLVVIGSAKMVTFDDINKKLVLYDQRIEIVNGEPVPVESGGDELGFKNDEPLRLECEAFLYAMATRKQPLTDGRSGLRVLQILQAAQDSVGANGRPVSLFSSGSSS